MQGGSQGKWYLVYTYHEETGSIFTAHDRVVRVPLDAMSLTEANAEAKTKWDEIVICPDGPREPRIVQEFLPPWVPVSPQMVAEMTALFRREYLEKAI